jgi:hypothetical protein
MMEWKSRNNGIMEKSEYRRQNSAVKIKSGTSFTGMLEYFNNGKHTKIRKLSRKQESGKSRRE